MGSSGVGGSLSAASDVSLNSPVDNQVLKRQGGYWKNLADSGASPTLATMPAGYIHSISQNSDGTWPAAGSSRTDITYQWIGYPGRTEKPTPVSGAINLYDYRES